MKRKANDFTLRLTTYMYTSRATHIHTCWIRSLRNDDNREHCEIQTQGYSSQLKNKEQKFFYSHSTLTQLILFFDHFQMQKPMQIQRIYKYRYEHQIN